MKKYIAGLFNKITQDFWMHYPWYVALTVLIYVVFNLGDIYGTEGKLFYIDTDCYTRATRILDWLQNFQWNEKLMPYGNPPQGFVLHFTRICDVIWLALSLPFMPFMELKEAIFWGGMFFSPLFLTLTLICSLWGIKPYIPESCQDKEKIFLLSFIMMMAFALKLTTAFDFYRPDHHALMGFALAFNLAVLLRSYCMQNIREIMAAGVLSGCGMWASSAPEGLLVVGLVLLILCINCIFYKQSTIYPLYYSLGLFYAVILAWLVNPPLGGWTVVDNTRLSLLQAVLVSLILLSFMVWHFANLHGRVKKAITLTFLAVISAALMLLCFGYERIFAPVYDEFVYKHFIPRIDEMLPIFKAQAFTVPAVIMGAVVICFMLGLSKGKQAYIITLSILYMFTAGLGSLIVRLFIYYIPVWMVIYTLGLFMLWLLKDKYNKYKIVIFLYIVLPVFYLASFNYVPHILEAKKVDGVVLTDLFMTPNYIYNGNDTIGSPYHSNIEGVNNNYTMWFTADENELKTLIKKHQVNYIILTVYDKEFYANPEDNTDKLYGKVISGKNLYPWMDKVDERMYKVNYELF